MTEESDADPSEPPGGAPDAEDASREDDSGPVGHGTSGDGHPGTDEGTEMDDTGTDNRVGGDDGRASGDAAPATEDPNVAAAGSARGLATSQTPTESGGAGPDDGPPDPADLTVEERSLHPRIRTIWLVRTTILGLILGGIAAVVDAAELGIGPIVPVGVTAVALLVLLPIPVLRYRAWRYEIREDAIYLERGVFTRVRTVVPYVRIQHVDTARGPIARATGLARLVVYTAGSRGADVTIPGLALEDARDHQRRLKQLAIAAEDDTAV